MSTMYAENMDTEAVLFPVGPLRVVTNRAQIALCRQYAFDIINKKAKLKDLLSSFRSDLVPKDSEGGAFLMLGYLISQSNKGHLPDADNVR